MRIGGQHGGQIHRARTLGAVEAPYGLDGQGIHVEGFHAVAPAGRDGQGCGDVLRGKEFLAFGRFRAAADGAGGNDGLHGRAVRVAQRLDQRLGGMRHAHGLLLQAFAYAAPAAVDDGTNADFGIRHFTVPPYWYWNIFCSRGDARLRGNNFRADPAAFRSYPAGFPARRPADARSG